jgi:protein-S-isoprenylcysteine O-methyltransferase Ste14
MNTLENKIPPPVVAVLLGGLMWGGSAYLPSIDMAHLMRVVLALLVFCAGVFFALSGAVSFRRAKTTVNPLKPETASALVSTGIYRYSRNPMYVGFAMFLTAWALYLASPLLLLGVLGFVLYMNRFQITPEERALTSLFGADFLAYQAKVRRWL